MAKTENTTTQESGLIEMTIEQVAKKLNINPASLKVKRTKKARTIRLNGDVEHDSKYLLKVMLSDATSAIGRFRTFKAGKVTRDGTEYKISLTDKSLEYIEGQLTKAVTTLMAELRNSGVSDTGMDEIPY